MKRTFIAAAAALLAFNSPAQADNAQDIAEQLSLGDQLLVNIQPLLPMMSNQMVTQLRQAGLPLVAEIEQEGKGGLPRFKSIFEEEFVAQLKLQLPELDNKVAGLLRDTLTAAELAQTKSFVQTQAGTKFLGVMLGTQGEIQQFGETAGMRAGAVAGQRAIERAREEMF